MVTMSCWNGLGWMVALRTKTHMKAHYSIEWGWEAEWHTMLQVLIPKVKVQRGRSKFTLATRVSLDVPLSIIMGYEFKRALADFASILISRSQSDTHPRKNAFGSSLLRSSSPLEKILWVHWKAFTNPATENAIARGISHMRSRNVKVIDEVRVVCVIYCVVSYVSRFWILHLSPAHRAKSSFLFRDGKK